MLIASPFATIIAPVLLAMTSEPGRLELFSEPYLFGRALNILVKVRMGDKDVVRFLDVFELQVPWHPRRFVQPTVEENGEAICPKAVSRGS